MKLSELDFIKLLPSLMRDDECVQALSSVINDIFASTAEDIEKLSDWDRIDTMTESELDYLAWECNISWYDKTADVDVKRSICKNSDKIFMTRATVSAVEEVISTYFSNASLREFFVEEDGTPHYFKIETTDIDTYNEKLEQFLRILEKVKRKSQWLEAIVLLLQGKGSVYAGVGVCERVKTTFYCTV